jgi:hypothetical protein
MKQPFRIAYLQLPRLDNDVTGPRENAYLAAQCLQRALDRAGMSAVALLPPGDMDERDNAGVVEWVMEVQPDILACTLYLWNVERTLRIVRRLRHHVPNLRIVGGGPEVAVGHPFLFRSRCFDALVCGEGESVFPSVCRWLAGGSFPDYAALYGLHGGQYRRGTRPVRGVTMTSESDPTFLDPQSGVVYVESGRGCALRCAYCCYNQQRRGVSFVPPETVVAAVRARAEAGAREFRFIDPTLNAHPQFEDILHGLAALNRDGTLAFFGELRADRVGAGLGRALRAAHFTEVEVGVQSLDPHVLKAVKRPARSDSLAAGIREITGEGVPLTLDLMCGLPHQGFDDVARSLQWAYGVRGARVQFMHTLLLPGTLLRRNRRSWHPRAQVRPPYRVLETPWLSETDFWRAEELAEQLGGGEAADCRTARFVGRRLPDRFRTVTRVRVGSGADLQVVRSGSARQAIEFHGQDLFSARHAITSCVRREVRREPDALFQFILVPEHEEPLDLLDAIVAVLDEASPHVVDRWPVGKGARVHAARRVMVRLPQGRPFDREWVCAAEACLETVLY